MWYIHISFIKSVLLSWLSLHVCQVIRFIKVQCIFIHTHTHTHTYTHTLTFEFLVYNFFFFNFLKFLILIESCATNWLKDINEALEKLGLVMIDINRGYKVPSDNSLYFCSVCNRQFSCKSKNLEKHADSVHHRNINNIKNNE